MSEQAATARDLEEALERVLDRRLRPLEEQLRRLEGQELTLDVKGAAKLLHTSPRAIYLRHERGQMPRPLPGRRLIWRKADLLRGK